MVRLTFFCLKSLLKISALIVFYHGFLKIRQRGCLTYKGINFYFFHSTIQEHMVLFTYKVWSLSVFLTEDKRGESTEFHVCMYFLCYDLEASNTNTL